MVGGSGGSDQRIEVFLKIKKKIGGGEGGRGGAVGVDVKEEVKLL